MPTLRRSIGLPLALGIVLAILVLALAVGWQILVVGDPRPVASGLRTFDWVLLVLGTVFFALVMAGLVWLSAWLIREMRLNQRQRAFLDAVTHEMKTPLASIRLYLDTLSNATIPRRSAAGEFLDRMRVDLDRLDRTVDQVLTAARAEEPGAAGLAGGWPWPSCCPSASSGDPRAPRPAGGRRCTSTPRAGLRCAEMRRSSRWSSATCWRTPSSTRTDPVDVRVRVAPNVDGSGGRRDHRPGHRHPRP